MKIRDVIGALVTLQSGLSITDPEVVAIAKAYNYFPPQEMTLTDTPCWANEYKLVGIERSPSRFAQEYIIHSQLFVQNADDERAADIATEFLAEYLDALNQNVTLETSPGNPTCVQAFPAGGDPTLALLDRAGIKFIGLDMLLYVQLSDAIVFYPG